MLALIIDDDSDDREIFSEAIRTIDPAITCLEARDGEEGLNLLTRELTVLPDIVFLDINMPRMNGFQCLLEIKKHTRLKEIEVIIYSTTSSSLDIQTYRRLGAGFLAKQSEYNKLVVLLKGILKGKS